jgi:hypothetical protein
MLYLGVYRIALFIIIKNTFKKNSEKVFYNEKIEELIAYTVCCRQKWIARNLRYPAVFRGASLHDFPYLGIMGKTGQKSGFKAHKFDNKAK